MLFLVRLVVWGGFVWLSSVWVVLVVCGVASCFGRFAGLLMVGVGIVWIASSRF